MMAHKNGDLKNGNGDFQKCLFTSNWGPWEIKEIFRAAKVKVLTYVFNMFNMHKNEHSACIYCEMCFTNKSELK